MCLLQLHYLVSTIGPSLHLCWLVKVRFHTFLESSRLLTLSLSIHTVVQLVLAAGWGDAHWVGLTGVELLHAEGHTLPLTTQQVQVRLSSLLYFLSRLPPI